MQCALNLKPELLEISLANIEGSIPSTKKPATVDEPVYDYNPNTDTIEPEFSGESNITVMAVDNLPCELPRDASESFGQEMIENVFYTTPFR